MRLAAAKQPCLAASLVLQGMQHVVHCSILGSGACPSQHMTMDPCPNLLPPQIALNQALSASKAQVLLSAPGEGAGEA